MAKAEASQPTFRERTVADLIKRRVIVDEASLSTTVVDVGVIINGEVPTFYPKIVNQAQPAPEPPAVHPWMEEALSRKQKLIQQHSVSPICKAGHCSCIDRIDEIDHIVSIASAPSSAPTGPEVGRLVEAAEVVCYTSKGFPLAGAGFDELRSAIAAFRKDRG